MKKGLFKKIILFIAIVLCTVLICSKINHSIKLEKEKEELQSYGVGKLIDYNGEKINIFTAGNDKADSTIVFMHGLGMGDINISARPLLESFEDEYKICILDRYGSGLSDDTSKKQTVESIIEEYREILRKDNQKAPYILLAHSISGIYASYWAEKYPDEIKSIVYIDADPVGGYVQGGKVNSLELICRRGMNIVTTFGIQRILSSESSLLGETKNQVFTEEENNMRKLLMYHNTSSKAMCSEYELYYENAKTVLNSNINFNIPQLYICAINTEGDYFENVYYNKLEKRYNGDKDKIEEKINTEKEYANKKIEYMKKRKNVKVVKMSGPHALYEYNPEELYNTILCFLNETNKNS